VRVARLLLKVAGALPSSATEKGLAPMHTVPRSPERSMSPLVRRSALLAAAAALLGAALLACSSGKAGDSPSASSSTGSGTGGTGSSPGATGAGASTSTAGTGRSSSTTTSTGSGGASSSSSGTTTSTATRGAADAGIADAAADAPSTCTGDLSGIGAGDFRISFTLQTTQQDGSFALLNQRSACSAGDFWDIRIQNGTLVVETDALTDAAPDDAQLYGCATINDGKARAVVVQRAGGLLSAYVDGGLDNTSVPSTASFGALVARSTGTDSCVGVDGTTAFDGTRGSITNVCVSPVSVVQPDAGSSCP